MFQYSPFLEQPIRYTTRKGCLSKYSSTSRALVKKHNRNVYRSPGISVKLTKQAKKEVAMECLKAFLSAATQAVLFHNQPFDCISFLFCICYRPSGVLLLLLVLQWYGYILISYLKNLVKNPLETS